MEILDTLPMVGRMDSIGAIFMAENVRSGIRNRCNDTRYHFIKEHLEDGFIKFVHVRTDDIESLKILIKGTSCDLRNLSMKVSKSLQI
jgi:hypothetical protein